MNRFCFGIRSKVTCSCAATHYAIRWRYLVSSIKKLGRVRIRDNVRLRLRLRIFSSLISPERDLCALGSQIWLDPWRILQFRIVISTVNIISPFLHLLFLNSSISFGRPGVEFYGQHSVESGESAVTKIIALPNEVR